MKKIDFCSQLNIKENDSTEFFNLVLFDLDGTLIDSGRGIMHSLTYAFEKLGEPVPDIETLRKFIGPPLKWSFENICGYDEEKSLAGVKLYREHYPKEGIFENDVYEGVPKLIKYIYSKGAKIYLATSKPEVFAKRIIENIGLTQYFDGIVGSQMDNSRSDKAEIVELALSMGKDAIEGIINPIMIGDRNYDIIGAHKNHIKCIAVNNGYGSIEEYQKAGAEFIFDSMNDPRWGVQ